MTDKEYIETLVVDGQADKITRLAASFMFIGAALTQEQMTWLHNCIHKRGVDYVLLKVANKLKEDRL